MVGFHKISFILKKFLSKNPSGLQTGGCQIAGIVAGDDHHRNQLADLLPDPFTDHQSIGTP